MIERLNKKTLIIALIAVDVLLILITIGISFFQKERVSRIYTQQAAERWENKKMAYSEVSAFYGAGSADVKTVMEVRNNIMSKLVEDTYLDVTDQSGARVFIDAYCGSSQQKVERGVYNVTGEIYGVSDDFFLIHNIPLLSGTYMNPVEKAVKEGDGRDPFQIVLDENMAWNLFGSVDVAGMKVNLGDKVFTVMGVVEAFQTDSEKMAYGNYDVAYIPYKAYEIMKQEIPISCYEAVIPNPISGYALNTISSACGLGDNTEVNEEESRSSLNFGSLEIVENTDRYKAGNLIKYAKNKKYSSMRTSNVSFPFWENVARFETEHAYKVFRICCILMVLPALTVLGVLIWLYSKRGVVFNKKNKEKLIDVLGEFRDGIVEKLTKKEEENYDDDPDDESEEEPDVESDEVTNDIN